MSRDGWELYDERSNTSGTYYALRRRTTGTLDAPVTVKHTKHDTFACLTCLTTTCIHARFVQKYLERNAA
jgi:hypothetical protein